MVLDAILLKAALNFYASRAETDLMLATCELLTVLTKTHAPKYLHLLRERDAWPILMAAWRDLKGTYFFCLIYIYFYFYLLHIESFLSFTNFFQALSQHPC